MVPVPPFDSGSLRHYSDKRLIENYPYPLRRTGVTQIIWVPARLETTTDDTENRRPSLHRDLLTVPVLRTKPRVGERWVEWIEVTVTEGKRGVPTSTLPYRLLSSPGPLHATLDETLGPHNFGETRGTHHLSLTHSRSDDFTNEEVRFRYLRKYQDTISSFLLPFSPESRIER